MSATDRPRHVPVMVEEVLEALAVRPGARCVDATVGDGGHAERLLEASAPDGELVGLDRDAEALERARKRLASYASRLHLEHASFSALRELLGRIGWDDGADCVLVDLGVSSLQLESPARGFSFQADGPLDMRMDTSQGPTAAELVNELPEREIADLLWRFGEERASRRIAGIIAERRRQRRFATTAELRSAVVAAGVRGRPGHDPATRTFQALRIAVNREMEELERLLERGWELVRPGGRIAVLTYHSLEDRAVKQAFRTWAADCICPPGRPICDCGWHARARLVIRRRQRPSAEEVARNPRARSAGLRAVERLAPNSVH